MADAEKKQQPTAEEYEAALTHLRREIEHLECAVCEQHVQKEVKSVSGLAERTSQHSVKEEGCLHECGLGYLETKCIEPACNEICSQTLSAPGRYLMQPGIETEAEWNTCECSAQGYDEPDWDHDPASAVNMCWNTRDWSPYACNPGIDDVYCTRSFLSPVQEMPDEADHDPPRHKPAFIAPRASTPASSVAQPRAPSTATPTTSQKSLPVLAPLPFDSPVRDLASTLYIPTGMVPPLQLLPSFSFEKRSKHSSTSSTTSSPLSKKTLAASDTDTEASDKPQPDSRHHGIAFWNWRRTGTLEHWSCF